MLLLAEYSGDLSETKKGLSAEPGPVALVLLTSKIRDNAPKTFKYFAEQGVSIRVISGDNPATVSRIAQDAGIAGAERFIDSSELKTERQIRRAAADYTVFGRVTPDVKRRLIRAMKAEGHTVAMTGDGVNDVLALKDADCGIAMASGSEVACHVAQLVLVDSDFAAMPHVVMEGRRVINNIERSSSLFLVKNIFSFLMMVMALAFTLSYPITPSQLTLFNVCFIGIPSFVLALEPNRDRVRGRFLPNVLLKAIPAALSAVAAILTVMFVGARFGVSQDELSTMTTIAISFVGLIMLIKVSMPFNKIRRALVIAMPILFALGAVMLSELFGMTALSRQAIVVLLIASGAAVPLMLLFGLITHRMSVRLNSKTQRLRKRRVRV
ncbi:MAG: HAD-IC family P-type ATPase [Clostridiales bacterium]|nr:HAD-IC family P-type ATPase [Clostridiales bacterium]